MMLTPLKRRIVDALAEMPGLRMSYHDLAYKLWPPEQHAKGVALQRERWSARVGNAARAGAPRVENCRHSV